MSQMANASSSGSRRGPVQKPVPGYPVNPLKVFTSERFTFNYYGVRVPTIVVSPFIVPQSRIVSPNPLVPFDHTSIISTVMAWANTLGSNVQLQPLSVRDATAPTLFDDSSIWNETAWTGNNNSPLICPVQMPNCPPT